MGTAAVLFSAYICIMKRQGFWNRLVTSHQNCSSIAATKLFLKSCIGNQHILDATDENLVTTENEAYGLHSVPGRVPTVSETGIVNK